LDDLRAQGILKTPAPERTKIEVHQDLIWAWNAFWRLSVSRPVGFNGPLRITVGEVKAYADLYGFIPSKAKELLLYIDTLDALWMKHVEELREDEQEKRRLAKGDHTPRSAPRPPQKKR
jgi:hypothetical protein